MVERVYSETPTPLIRTLLGLNLSVLIRRVSLFQRLHIKSIICYLYTHINSHILTPISDVMFERAK